MNDYSESEQKLIAHFGFINLMDNLSSSPMYRLMVEEAFMKNDTSEYAIALRVANYAFTHRTECRGTKEFDALIEDALYTTEKRIADRNEKLIEFWNDHIYYIKEQIQHEKQEDSAFKWTQLVNQEIFMYNKINKQLDYDEFESLCKRRGFNLAQKEFIIKAMSHIGLTKNMNMVCVNIKEAPSELS